MTPPGQELDLGEARSRITAEAQRISRTMMQAASGVTLFDGSVQAAANRVTALQPQLDACVRAMQRVNAGTYGLCVSCHAPIPEVRLLTAPTIESCSGCEHRAPRG